MALIMRQNLLALSVLEGKKRVQCMPLNESLEIMKQMDQIRKEWPLICPMDSE